MKHHIFWALALTVVTGALNAQPITESYETHRWSTTFGGAAVTGYDGIQTAEGSSALHTQLTAGGAYAGIGAVNLLQETTAGITTGYSVQVYLDSQAGATGTPLIKMELNNGDAGSDTALVEDAWTTVTIPASSLTNAPLYNQLSFVYIDNGSSGVFDIWIDDLRIDGQPYDLFEASDALAINGVNIDNGFRDQPTVGGSRLAVAGPAPSDGDLALALDWDDDVNGNLEVRHAYSGLDIGQRDALVFDLYVKSGVTAPSLAAFIVDGSGGNSYQGGPTVSTFDSWQTYTIDLQSSAADETDLTEVILILNGTGANSAGRVYLDNLRYADTIVPSSEASITAETVVSPTVYVDFSAGDLVGVASTALFVKAPGSASFVDTGLTLTGASGAFEYTPSSGGLYEFYTIATDTSGNVEAAPATADDSIVVNIVENGAVSLDVSLGDSTLVFPMEPGLNVTIDITGVTVAGTVSVQRYEGDGAPVGSPDPAQFIDQSWEIIAGGGLVFTSADVTFEYDDALLGGVAEGDIDQAWRDDAGSVTTLPITLDDTANTAEVTTTAFSYWYLGDSNFTTVADWTLLED